MIAIIIPTYNEDKNILQLISSIKRFLPKAKILIVDDTPNSSLKKLIKNQKNLKLKIRIKKKGRGSAVLHGMKLSIKDKSIKTFIEMDADFSHKPSELKRNLKFFNKNKCDLLISSRYLPKSKIIDWSISRRILSRLSNFLAKKLLKINVSDYTNGYRIYSRNSVIKVIKKCGKIGDGFIVLSEILLTIDKSNLKIMEISSIFKNRVRGESSVSLNLVFKSFLGLIKLWMIKNFNYEK